MLHVKLHFNQKCPLKMGKNLFEVCQNLEGSSVASYSHVYENVDAVSLLQCVPWPKRTKNLKIVLFVTTTESAIVY
jgi:hypothetical protein